jgi:hypothetical protein
MEIYNNNVSGKNSGIDPSTVEFSQTGFHDGEYTTGGMNRDSWKYMLERLYNDMTHLFDRESTLVRTELSEKIRDVKAAGISMVIGGSLLFVGIITLAMTAIFLLSRVLPVWSASALVTAAFLIVGYVMTRTAIAKLDAERIKPKQSLETLGEIRTSFKERINEFKLHH